MQHAEQVAQIKTLMSRLDSGTNVDAGGLRRNPTSVYVDPDRAASERETFFEQHPQLIGLSGDLPGPGSFLTMDDLGTPILATRDADGNFKAFVNACRHRGVVLEERPKGEARRFTCSFHSWVYDTSGALVGVPKTDHFGDIDLGCNGLVELPSEERHGLLYVHPQPDGDLDVAALLGDELDAELASWNLAALESIGGDTYDVACNWKLAMDTFGETYHFNSLHANTLAMVFYGNVQCYDTYGSHHRMLLTRRDIDTLRDKPEDEWKITTAALPVYWLFPNVQLMPSDAGLYLVRAYPHPTEPGRHTSQINFYLWPEVNADPAMSEMLGEIAQRFGEIIRDEDYAASAGQQRTAESGAIEFSVFGRNEPALHHYHNTYRAALGDELLPLLDSV
jgi:phenylpropionate dioxygenase-like ring-hydroxylating dioxygenase large terminal subunit